MSIYVINRSSVVDDKTGTLIVKACNILMPKLAKDWNTVAYPILYKGKSTGSIPKGT